MLLPGDDWKGVIFQKLQTAQVILLLISKNFLASDFSYCVELQHALDRHRRGEVRVVPVILSPCDLSNAPFMKLQALPTNAEPITRWKNRDEAWADVASQLRTLIEVTQDNLREGHGLSKAPGQPRIDDCDHVDTILSRYARARSWLSDLRNFFGAVAGAGGISRVVRTFGMLTFRFDAFVSHISSTADTEKNCGFYLGPPNCIILFNVIAILFSLVIQRLSPVRAIDVYDFITAILLTIIGLIVFGVGLRFLSTKRRSVGEYMAMICYVCGAFTVPFLAFSGFGSFFILFVKPLLGIFGLPLFLAILSLAAIIFLLIVPFMLTSGIRRFTGQVSWHRNLTVVFSSIVFMSLSAAILQPGNTILLASIVCRSVKQQQCADSLNRIAISYQPRSESIWVIYVSNLMDQGESMEAGRILDEALKILPDSEFLHYMLAKNEAIDNPERAEQELMIAMMLNPEFEPAVRDLAQHLMDQNKRDQALRHCNMVLSSSRFSRPLKQQCKLILGAVLLRLGRLDEAVSHFRDLLSLPLDDKQRTMAQAYLCGLLWLKPELLEGKTMIVSVVPESLAARVGLRAADILLSLDGRQPNGVAAWIDAIRDRTSNEGQLIVLRDGGQTTLALPPTPKRIGIRLARM